MISLAMCPSVVKSAVPVVLWAALSLALFSCAPQSSASHSSSAPQSASQPASPIASNGACRINAKLICEGIRAKTILINDKGADKRTTERSSSRTAEIYRSIPGPHGYAIAGVRCVINTQLKSVTSAEVLKGPPLTEEDVAYLRKYGFCIAP